MRTEELLQIVLPAGTKYWLLWVGIVLLLALSLFLLRAYWVEQRGGATTDEVVTRYSAALRAEDVDTLLQLTPATHIVDPTELDGLISQTGGKAITDIQVAYVPSESANLAIVKLQGTYKSVNAQSEFTQTLYLQKLGQRWYLMLGYDKNGLPLDTPSTQVK